MSRNKIILSMIMTVIIATTGFVLIFNLISHPIKNKITLEQAGELKKGQYAENTEITHSLEKPAQSKVNPKYASEDTLTPADVSNRVVVKLSPGTNPEKVAQMVNAEIVRIGPLQFTTFALPANQMDTLVNKLRKSPGVLSVKPVRRFKTTVVKTMSVKPTDSLYPQQWGLSKADVQKAWDLGATGKGIIIAVVDTGVDLVHPDLKDNILSGYNAITGNEGSNSVQDRNGHGTHVSGIIAAELNGIGIVGVAYQAKILPIKSLTRAGEGSDDCIADGIVWATDHEAKIINLSLGSSSESDVLKEALQYSSDKGCLIVAAGGNKEADSTQTTISFPAADPHVLAITATNSNDQIAVFSLPGPQAALAAPGETIASDYWNGSSGYASLDGTSMASPFVAGVAALVWSVHPELNAQQIRIDLENSALDLDSIGRDNSYGFGRVNAYWAIRFADKSKPYPSPANLDWSGGIVQGGTANTSVSLNVPARSFGLDPNLGVTLSVEGTSGSSDLPTGILPIGDAISIQWSGSINKLLGLALTTLGDHPASDRVGYIFHWSGSRWILIGGGINAPTINAGITEPGIYRVGYTLLSKNQRIAGNDRTQTSIMISQHQFSNGTDTVILARSDDYSDALTGVPLAYKVHAPILLTPSSRLPVDVFTEIQRLAPKKIILLGGTVALSPTIEQQLQGSFSLERLGGVTRYETAALIASALGTIGQAIIVNGNNFPDAISIASTAAQHGMPILITDTHSMPEETDIIMRQLLISETIVGGGEAVVAQTIYNSLPNPTRLFGNDRYDTAVAILKAYPPQGSLLFIATGDNFPDALSGGVIAAINQTGLVLVPPFGPTLSEISVFKTWHGKSIYVFGGIVAVPQAVVQQIQGII